MSDPDLLSACLACPRCDRTPLTTAGDHLHCGACRVDFPILEGIPCLYAEPQAALAEWRGRLDFELRKLEHAAQAARARRDQPGLLEPTRERLTLLAEASESQAAHMQALLAPLAAGQPAAAYETHLALRTRLPPQQGIATYYTNVFRDWSWGEPENTQACEIVIRALTGSAPRKVLVLGAGACRLAYDVHQRLAPEVTVALDLNPFLLLVAARVTTGNPVELYEFPIAPRRLQDTAVLRRLAAESPVAAGFHLIIGDALRPPIARDCFDTVITPWLIDIVAEDLRRLAPRINRLLPIGGRWINFGSLAFASTDPAQCYSLEEALAIVAEAGFEEPAWQEDDIPYMCSPASRHGRRERALTFSASKHKQARRPERHSALPEWIVTDNKPVPLLRSFQVQAASTRIFAYLMSLIDGRRSIRDLALLLEQQRLMTREDAVPAIRNFLIRMYDESETSDSA